MTLEITPALVALGVALVGSLITAIVMLRITAKEVEKIVPKVEDLERRFLERGARIEALERVVGEQGRPGSLLWAKWEHENALRKWIFRLSEIEKRIEKHSTRLEVQRATLDELEITGRHEAIAIPREAPRPARRLPPRDDDNDGEDSGQ